MKVEGRSETENDCDCNRMHGFELKIQSTVNTIRFLARDRRKNPTFPHHLFSKQNQQTIKQTSDWMKTFSHTFHLVLCMFILIEIITT